LDFCKHWAVVFKFDNREIVYEILQEKNDAGKSIIIPKWSDKAENGLFSNFYDLKKVQTSPKHLRELADSVKYNGKEYNVFIKNCQEWAKEFLEKVDPELIGRLNKAKIKSFKARVTEFAVASAASSSLSSVASSPRRISQDQNEMAKKRKIN
jgi:hypothetical protein